MLVNAINMYRKNLEGNTEMLKMAKSREKDWWDSFILVCFLYSLGSKFCCLYTFKKI